MSTLSQLAVPLLLYSLIATALWRRSVIRYHRRFADLDQLRHDPVTGLLVRRPWVERAHPMLRSMARPVVALCDLNGFKRVNDELSHADGDQVLALFARELRARFGPHALLGRFGGDEFVVLIDTAPDDSRADAVVEAAHDTVVFWRGRAVGASFGIVRAADLPPFLHRSAKRSVALNQLSRLLHAADLAGFEAKEVSRAEQLTTAITMYDPRIHRVPIQLATTPRGRARHADRPAGCS